MRILITVLSAAAMTGIACNAQAFCGFYVARADTDLYNRASQVVLVRDQNRTVITMANDFQGDVRDFAVVIPVPTRIEREQINVADNSLVDRLDAYTSPRLVEYHDGDPCVSYELMKRQEFDSPSMPAAASSDGRSARARGVTIEASYTVGEYDILILSATQSDGLIEWLGDNGYRIPAGANRVVDSYLRQQMRFFVAKVNLEEQAKLGYTKLRPLQVAFESRKFMLPIRLGTLNALGKQELFVYTLTRTGRVETTNYRTVRLPSDVEVPEFVESEFGDFYRAMFERRTQSENASAIFLEYAWDMAWCDPCAADPLTDDELRRLGVFWVDGGSAGRFAPSGQNAFVTRLHVSYDREGFPEDLVFQETGDRQNFQGRYILRRPWRAATTCDASGYRASVRERQEREAQTLAGLTGWSIESIRERIAWLGDPQAGSDQPWWRRLWR